MNAAAYLLESLAADPNLAAEFKRLLPLITPADIAEMEAINAKEAQEAADWLAQADREEWLREREETDYRGRPL